MVVPWLVCGRPSVLRFMQVYGWQSDQVGTLGRGGTALVVLCLALFLLADIVDAGSRRRWGRDPASSRAA
jgi:hypothetical protein